VRSCGQVLGTPIRVTDILHVVCVFRMLTVKNLKQKQNIVNTWYLILDDVGLSKQMLLNAPLCTIIETILEVVYWTRRNHSSWKTVPNVHNTLTEKNLIGYSYGSSGLSSWTGDHGGCFFYFCCIQKNLPSLLFPFLWRFWRFQSSHPWHVSFLMLLIPTRLDGLHTPASSVLLPAL